MTGATNQTLATLTTEVQQINHNFSTLMPAIQNLQQQSTPQPELSALESMLESAVMRGLKRHHEEFQKNQPTLSHPSSEVQPQTHVNTFPQNSDQTFCSESDAMLRRDKTVFRTAFRTPLFDIEIVTKEAQRIPKSKKGTSCHEILQVKPSPSQQFTKYKVRVKIPFWRGGMTYHSGNAGMMYGGNRCKTFRTYNIVLHDAPIIKACRNLDLPEVRRLFDAGLASPLDFDYQGDRSLVDTVVWSLAYGLFRIPDSQHEAGIPLLRFLIHCLDGDIGKTRGVTDLLFVLWESPSPMDTHTSQEEAFRLLLAHCSADPLDSVAHFPSIQVSKTSLYRILVTQDIWWVNRDAPYDEPVNAEYWTETDFRMLKDPAGISLKTALETGYKYRPKGVRYIGFQDDTLHSLLIIASETMEEEFHNCVCARLVIMIKHGLDPRSISFTHNFFGRGRLQIKDALRRPLSCTEVAQFLGLETLWTRSLAGAGWCMADIDDLFEEDLVLATISLLSGRIEYRSRNDTRRDFIQAVRLGEFANLKKEEIWSLSTQSEVELGLSSRFIGHMIIEVNSVFKTRKTPGSWLDEADMILMPGKDFQLPYNYAEGGQLKDWQCIRDIWENELGGVIPEGYAGSVYDRGTDQWV